MLGEYTDDLGRNLEKDNHALTAKGKVGVAY